MRPYPVLLNLIALASHVWEAWSPFIPDRDLVSKGRVSSCEHHEGL